jgi:uncharacterized protein (DUF1697 family)
MPTKPSRLLPCDDCEVVFVAFLRAINLGRVNRVPMAGLRVALSDFGFRDVTTHLQSGNVVLATPKRSPTAVAAAVELWCAPSSASKSTSWSVRAASSRRSPRPNALARRGVDHRTLHVAFLKTRPAAAARRAFAGRKFGDDEFVIRGAEVYLRYPHGVAGSKMNTAMFEGGLGTPATVRTWKVVSRVNELATARAAR